MGREAFNNLDITIGNGRVTLKNSKGISHKKITVNIEDIRTQIRINGDQKTYNKGNYDVFYERELENYGLPYMNFIFYYFFCKNMRVPTLEEMVDSYIKTYCEVLPDGRICCKPVFNSRKYIFTKEALIGRIYRSINSFYREIELLFQLMEYEDIEVKYDFQDDLDGIDFTVTCRGQEFYLASWVGTNRSRAWKKIKDKNRHADDKRNLIDIVAVIKPDSSRYNMKNYNGVFVYSPKFVARKYIEILQKAEC